MSDQTTHDKLNASVETIISGRDFAATGDPEVDVLARLALGLRGLPARGFKARLRAELIPGLEARGLSGLLARLRAAVSFDRGTGLAAAGGGCGLAGLPVGRGHENGKAAEGLFHTASASLLGQLRRAAFLRER